MPELFRNFTGGIWAESASGEAVERRNPATGKLVSTFTESGPADVDVAVLAAKTALRSWRVYPAPKRGETRVLGRARQPTGSQVVG